MNYYDIKAINATLLKEANKSLAHARLLYEDGVSKQATPAMKLGTLVHCMVLEPDEVHARYAIKPEIDRRTKAGKAQYEVFLTETAGKDVVDAGDFCKAEAMAEAVLNHRAAELLTGQMEFIAQWGENTKEGDEHMPMKALFDCVDDFAGRVVDLKTAQDASPEGFMKSAWNFGYHIQAAHYQQAYAALYGPLPAFYFVVVENSAPYNVAVYKASEAFLDAGHQIRERLLKALHESITTGVWPGYPDETIELNPPKWAGV